jgi:hypothetical protein
MAAFSCPKMQPAAAKRFAELAYFKGSLRRELLIVLIWNYGHICNHGI